MKPASQSTRSEASERVPDVEQDHDQGVRPAVLVVFDDELAAHHFLRVGHGEMERTGSTRPCGVLARATATGGGAAGTRLADPVRARGAGCAARTLSWRREGRVDRPSLNVVRGGPIVPRAMRVRYAPGSLRLSRRRQDRPITSLRVRAAGDRARRDPCAGLGPPVRGWRSGGAKESSASQGPANWSTHCQITTARVNRPRPTEASECADVHGTAPAPGSWDDHVALAASSARSRPPLAVLFLLASCGLLAKVLCYGSSPCTS